MSYDDSRLPRTRSVTQLPGGLFATLKRPMKRRRYRVETQASNSTTWEVAYYTGSLPVAKVHAARLWRSQNLQAVRVVDQVTGRVMANEQG